ncbi:hypothetical protein BJV77DRAFT_958928 [Russula vinacea]|nr:hypothetical protein BJV77DRAFT_958928 [Russula vinacea]
MNHRERRAYDIYEEDPCATPRAGTFEFVDAVLPWRFEDPLPPPVPPKNDLKATIPKAIPERVTPGFFGASADVRGSPKPPAYAYHAVQQQIRPSEERLGAVRPPPPPSGDNVAIPAGRPVTPAPQQVQPRTPPKPAVVDRSARSEAQRAPTLHSASPSPQPQPSIRSAHEERSRPRTAAPLRTAVLPERAPLPSYHSAEPFPAPPPYRASAEDSHAKSGRSRSLPRSLSRVQAGYKISKEFGDAVMRQEVRVAIPTPDHTRLDPEPTPLSGSAVSRIQAGYKVSKEFGDAVMRQEVRVAIPTPDHTKLDPASSQPPLSSSAVSRIQAGYKVSKEFGDAIMRQEVRMAIPTPDHDSTPTLRAGRRFMSASELQSFRKAKQRTDRGPWSMKPATGRRASPLRVLNDAQATAGSAQPAKT